MEIAFKYDEEVFLDYDDPNYFYPSINTTYPFSLGEEFEKGFLYNRNGMVSEK